MTNGACYVRVSTDNQLENYSIDEQTERLLAYCKAKDITIVNIYTDGGYSGGNTNRPALQQMLRDIEGSIIDVVVVYKLDRLSRSQKDTLMLIEDKFLANHVDFVSINENFDTSTPFGRAMIGILSVFAQLEKDQITERFTMGRIGRAKSGYFHGGAYAPTGYDYVDGNLVVNDYEAMQIRELYERFAKGHTLHSCWRYMQDKYTTKYGGWNSEALIRNVLKNEVYIGKVKFKGQTYSGQHAPIISQELFDQVQAMFQNASKSNTNWTRSPFKAQTLLSNFLYCGKCGARFHGEHGNYSCYSRTKGDKRYVVDPGCKNKKWKIEQLDSLVIHALADLDFSELEAQQSEAPPLPKTDYSSRIDEIDRQTEKLIELYQIGGIPIETISKKVQALAKEKNALSEALKEPQMEVITLKDLLAARDRLLSLMASSNLQEKRYCLSMLVDKIIVNGDKITIKIRKV